MGRILLFNGHHVGRGEFKGRRGSLGVSRNDFLGLLLLSVPGAPISLLIFIFFLPFSHFLTRRFENNRGSFHLGAKDSFPLLFLVSRNSKNGMLCMKKTTSI